MHISIKSTFEPECLFDTLKCVSENTLYKVIAENEDNYSMDHVTIKDDMGEELVIFYDEYEIIWRQI